MSSVGNDRKGMVWQMNKRMYSDMTKLECKHRYDQDITLSLSLSLSLSLHDIEIFFITSFHINQLAIVMFINK